MSKPDEVPTAEQADDNDERRPAVDEGGSAGTIGALDGSAAIGSAGAVLKDEREDAARGAPDPTFGPD